MAYFSLAFARDVFEMMKNFLKSFKIQTKYGTTAGATASSVIISGIGLMLIYAYTQRKKEKKTQRVFTRSMSIGALHGGRIAMKRMLQYHKIRANQEIQHDYLEKLENTMNTDTPDFPHIQNVMAKMEMIGQEDKAIEILKKAVKEAKEKSLSYHEYEYQMLLVEALIYKGDIEEAAKAECLNHDEPSDVRRLLYKTIIELLLNNPQEAEEEWEKFREMREQFFLPPDIKDSGFYKLVNHFEDFKRVVDLLKQDIDQKKKTK
ncbi:hypothetical protein SDJN02_10464, partial [Cucurbita argyrosperma subsp. argyrosperma]